MICREGHFGGADKIEIVRDLFPYGGVPGTEFDHPKKSKIGWFGEMGLILGDIIERLRQRFGDDLGTPRPG